MNETNFNWTCVRCGASLGGTTTWIGDRQYHPECVPHTAELPTKQPWKCPVCDGQGHVIKPPWVAGDLHEWTAYSTASNQCRACNGTGIVWGHRDRPHQ